MDSWLGLLPDLIGPFYPWLNGGHVLFLGLLIGAIAVLDLRLLGAFRQVAVPQLVIPTTRMAALGLVGAVLTGILLFSVQPAHYAANTVFLGKLLIVAAGLGNAVLLRRSRAWRQAVVGGTITIPVRISAAFSLCAWVAAVFAGRWIAYL